MNKAEFVEAVAARLAGDKKAAAAAVDSVIQTVYHNVAKGERVAITGFGIFEKRVRAARTARNPATGASVKVKKTSVPAFRAGAEFKSIVSGAKKSVAPPKPAKAAPVKKTVATKVVPATKTTPAKATATKTTPAKATPAKATATKTTPAKKVTAAAKTLAKAAPAKKSAPAKKVTAAAKTLAKAPAKKAPAAKRTPAKRA